MAFKLSDKAEKRLAEIQAKYPDPKSAVMPALSIAQEELGYLSDEAIQWVADRTGIAPVHVRELATSYSLYYTRPIGKYHCQVCGTLSCAVNGARELMMHLAKRFGTAPGEVTADGMWSWAQVECLGSCGTAPVCQINDTYFENLTVDKLEAILVRIEKEKPDLSISTLRDGMASSSALRASEDKPPRWQ
jgi:NADH-quinone oxidoreductase E subunit